MAQHIIADIHACTDHFLVTFNLAFNPAAPLSRQFWRHTEIRTLDQYNDGAITGGISDFAGQFYTYFSNGDQNKPFDLNVIPPPFPPTDTLAINYYPLGAQLGDPPTVITNTKDFYNALIVAMGADNAAIVFNNSKKLYIYK